MDPQKTEQLNRYLDAEMPANEVASFEAWLEVTPDARAELESLRELRCQLSSVELPTPSVEGQWQAFEKKVHRLPKSTENRVLSFPRLSAIAAVLLLGLVLWFAFSGGWPQVNSVASDRSHSVELVESDFIESSPIVYLDQQSGWIVIWVDETVDDDPIS